MEPSHCLITLYFEIVMKYRKNECFGFFRATDATATGVNFINVLRTAFTLVDPESVKRYWRLNCIFCAFGIYKRKSCTLNVDEINPRFPSFLWWLRFNNFLQTTKPWITRDHYFGIFYPQTITKPWKMFTCNEFCTYSCVATSVFSVRLLHAVAFSK